MLLVAWLRASTIGKNSPRFRTIGLLGQHTLASTFLTIKHIFVMSGSAQCAHDISAFDDACLSEFFAES